MAIKIAKERIERMDDSEIRHIALMKMVEQEIENFRIALKQAERQKRMLEYETSARAKESKMMFEDEIANNKNPVKTSPYSRYAGSSVQIGVEQEKGATKIPSKLNDFDHSLMTKDVQISRRGVEDQKEPSEAKMSPLKFKIYLKQSPFKETHSEAAVKATSSKLKRSSGLRREVEETAMQDPQRSGEEMSELLFCSF
ncbi:hypothetical protein Sjap_022188 [Stephania japonica]|uniref:Uncharacterized protein n=1 Tax=Stephania japonica TaxID=461633 RepID=A0AAP0HU71_9MAGN